MFVFFPIIRDNLIIVCLKKRLYIENFPCSSGEVASNVIVQRLILYYLSNEADEVTSFVRLGHWSLH